MKYNLENLGQAVAQSRRWSDVCIRVGIEPHGGSQHYLKKKSQEFGIDFSHFSGTRGPKVRPLEEYFSNQFPIGSHPLKLRLFSEGIKDERCEECGLNEWRSETLPLTLDHINGNHYDNALINLQILCANCHSVKTRKQRSISCTGCGGPVSRRAKTGLCILCYRRENGLSPRFLKGGCIECGVKVSHGSDSGFCKKHLPHDSKIEWPSTEYLLGRLEVVGAKGLGKELGVTGVAVAKHLKKVGVWTPKHIEWPDNDTLIAEVKLHGRTLVSQKLGASESSIRKRINKLESMTAATVNEPRKLVHP